MSDTALPSKRDPLSRRLFDWSRRVNLERRVAIVSFVPGTLDANKLADALYANEKVGVTTRGGKDRPGIRVSPHFYNSPAEVDRLLAGLGKYLNTGL